MRGLDVYRAEHPELLIVPVITNKCPFGKTKFESEKNINALTYLDSKLLYIDKIVNFNLDKLSKHFSYQRCKTKQQLLKHFTTIAHTNPAEFA